MEKSLISSTFLIYSRTDARVFDGGQFTKGHKVIKLSSLSNIVAMLCLSIMAISLANSCAALSTQDFEVTVWPGQSIYDVGSIVSVCFSSSVQVSQAEIRWFGAGFSETKTLNYTGPGLAEVELYNSTVQHIGNWIVEFSAFAFGQARSATSRFAVVSQISWTNDFDYEHTQDFWNDWYSEYAPYNDNESMSIGGGVLTLENPMIEGDADVRHNMTSILGSNSIEVLDWRVESRAKWIGRSCGSFDVTVWTGQAHRYCFSLCRTDLTLTKDYANVFNYSDWILQENASYTFALERQGSLFSMYIDRTIIGTYNDTSIPTAIENLCVGVGWDSAASFEYVSFRALNSFSLRIVSDYGSPQGSGRYREGATVSIFVTPSFDYDNTTRCTFIGWTGGFNSTDDPAYLSLHSPMKVTARWKINHEGDLVVSGDEVREIQNCEYRQNGNIVLNGNSVLVVREASLILDQNHTLQHNITMSHSASLIVERASVTSEYVFQIRCWENSRLDMTSTNASVPWIYSHDNSSMNIKDSVSSSILCHDTSRVVIDNSEIRSLFCAETSETTVTNSTVEELSLGLSDTNQTVVNLQPSKFIHWNSRESMSVSESVLLEQTNVLNWSTVVGGSETSVRIVNSTLKSISLDFGSDSNVTLRDLPRGRVDFWDLHMNNTVAKSHVDLTLSQASVQQFMLVSFDNAYVSVRNSTVDGIELDGMSSMDVDDCTVGDTHCWNSSSLLLADSLVDGNLFFWERSKSRIVGVNITNNAMCYDCSNTSFIDSAVLGDVIAWDNATLSLANVPKEFLDRVKINGEARVEVNWDVDIVVTVQRNPIENARVLVERLNGSPVAEVMTDQSGAAHVTLAERIMYLEGGNTQTDFIGNYTIQAGVPSVIDDTTRYVFDGWSGDLKSVSNPAFITINKTTSIMASWMKQHYLMVESEFGSSGTGWYDSGSVANFSVVPVIDCGNGSRRVFVGWTDGFNSENASTSIVVDRPISVVARWKTQYYLSIDSEYGTIEGGQRYYNSGDKAEFYVVNPIIDYGNRTRRVFECWSGDSQSTNSSTYVVMSRPMTISANWRKEYLLLVSSRFGSIEGSGWIEANKNATISVDETVGQFWFTHQFTHWSGDFSGTTAEAQVMMTSDLELIANWETYIEPISFLVIVAINSTASVGIMILTRRKETRWPSVYVMGVGSFAILVLFMTFNFPLLLNWNLFYLICFIVFGLFPSTLVTLLIEQERARIRSAMAGERVLKQGETIGSHPQNTQARWMIEIGILSATMLFLVILYEMVQIQFMKPSEAVNYAVFGIIFPAVLDAVVEVVHARRKRR